MTGAMTTIATFIALSLLVSCATSYSSDFDKRFDIVLQPDGIDFVFDNGSMRGGGPAKMVRSTEGTEKHTGFLPTSTHTVEFNPDTSYDSRYSSGITEMVKSDTRSSKGTLKGKDAPVLYRYFGKERSARARFRGEESVPFILLGPCVDHWKEVGSSLKAKGFNVMACELTKIGEYEEEQHENHSPETLVLAVLDALRWRRAILVGCDSETSLAIQATLSLSPDRIVGLILCGDLTSANSLVARDQGFLENKASAIDSFLERHATCPTTIICDGDSFARGPEDTRSFVHRSVIIGGGLAPHRRLPEEFAWVLTRFAEQHVAIPPTNIIKRTPRPDYVKHGTGLIDNKRNLLALDDIIPPGSLLVTGRFCAQAISLLSVCRAVAFQYRRLDKMGSMLLGIVSFASSLLGRILLSSELDTTKVEEKEKTEEGQKQREEKAAEVMAEEPTEPRSLQIEEESQREEAGKKTVKDQPEPYSLQVEKERREEESEKVMVEDARTLYSLQLEQEQGKKEAEEEMVEERTEAYPPQFDQPQQDYSNHDDEQATKDSPGEEELRLLRGWHFMDHGLA